MSHFSRSALESDAGDLARLREILHGRGVTAREGRLADTSPREPARVAPTIEERFGIAAAKGPRGRLAAVDGPSR